MEMFLNNKSTLKYYDLDLQSCFLSTAIRKRQLYSVPGSDGQKDLMKGMGPPRYESRTVRATFKVCAADPQQALERVIDELEGQTTEIVLPGDLDHYMVGDIHITSAGSGVGAEVVIVATCQPWRFCRQQVVINIEASEVDVLHTWYNNGKRDVVPELSADAEFCIAHDGVQTTWQPGRYLMSDLSIPGKSAVSVMIRGSALTVSYQEAIL